MDFPRLCSTFHNALVEKELLQWNTVIKMKILTLILYFGSSKDVLYMCEIF